MKYTLTLLSIALAIFLLWLINTGPAQKVLIIAGAIVTIAGIFYVSWVLGELVVAKSKKEINPYQRFFTSLIIGVIILYSIWKIIESSGCKPIPY